MNPPQHTLLFIIAIVGDFYLSDTYGDHYSFLAIPLIVIASSLLGFPYYLYSLYKISVFFIYYPRADLINYLGWAVLAGIFGVLGKWNLTPQ